MAPDGAPPGKLRRRCQRRGNGIWQRGVDDRIGFNIRSSAYRSRAGISAATGLALGTAVRLCAAGWRTVRLRRRQTVTGLLGSAGGRTLRLRRGLTITSILGSRGALRLCCTRAVASRGCPTGAAGPRAGISAVGRRSNSCH